MPFEQTIGQSVTAGGALVSKSKAYSAGHEKNLSEAVPNASTDLQFVFTLDVSAVKSFYAVSDQDITVETNNGGTPVNTLALKANVPYIWTTDSYDTFKLTADVTSLFVTNASGQNATLDIRSLVDPTP
jgi:hypothetical protein